MTNALIFFSFILKYVFSVLLCVTLFIFISMVGSEIIEFLKANPQWCIGTGFGLLISCILMVR